MANMSYCAFENTSRDIDQLIGMIEEVGGCKAALQLNDYEQFAWDDLTGKMEELTELISMAEANAESDANYDTGEWERKEKGIEDLDDTRISAGNLVVIKEMAMRKFNDPENDEAENEYWSDMMGEIENAMDCRRDGERY